MHRKLINWRRNSKVFDNERDNSLRSKNISSRKKLLQICKISEYIFKQLILSIDKIIKTLINYFKELLTK